MFMISGWWLLAALAIGSCLGILLVAMLHVACHGDDVEERYLSGAYEERAPDELEEQQIAKRNETAKRFREAGSRLAAG
ncbi:MAG: hypothetical protein ACYC9Z_01490 [Casimicrobiaceae bacterium]